MRVAIPSYECDLNSNVFEHFGRAPCYIIIDIENGEIRSVNYIENPNIEEHSPGEIPRLLHENNVDVLIARGVGRRAIFFFSELGINVITGATGRIKDIIEKFIRGELYSTPYEPREKWRNHQ